ncbi:hypothetical protein SAMN06265339_1488 [Desulfurobacterium pacificum]|jgi:cell division protein FtsI/penicillin-binding protein 2|uniref:Uncharacterized protein n=1 Tax=Desulfurobacterium pacificum TaxID=240166 RepID=A0ABY1NT28_9BACT|nr:hypothetical protein [Desulfurobacterium pacificum]SMP16565.1 hypothetical protein SAMN06265339_1488 [Desulfurobacterium pacificum]
MGTSLNQDIKLGKSTFHVQTEYYASSKKIVSNIFKDGAIVKRLEKDISTEEAIDEEVKNFHESVVRKLLSRPKKRKLELSNEVFNDILELVSPLFGIMSTTIVEDCLKTSNTAQDLINSLKKELTEDEAKEVIPKVIALLELNGYSINKD